MSDNLDARHEDIINETLIGIKNSDGSDKVIKDILQDACNKVQGRTIERILGIT